MATKHSDIAIESFFELQERLDSFIRVVPFDSAHTRTYSPLLTSLLLDTSSFIEAVLKSTMDNQRYNHIPGIAAIRAKRYSDNPPYLTINDLRTVFRSDMFYGKRVWFLSRAKGSFPWSCWSVQHGAHPAWWGAYNHVKHDQFGRASEARYLTTVHALEAAFLVMVQSLEFRKRLVERGIIRCKPLGAPALIALAAAWEPLRTQEVVVARTRLFGYKFMTSGSPTYASDASVFL